MRSFDDWMDVRLYTHQFNGEILYEMAKFILLDCLRLSKPLILRWHNRLTIIS